MSGHIISDLQVMANVESKLGEISEKIGKIESEYKNLKTYHGDTWGTNAKEEYFSKATETSGHLSRIGENLRNEKKIIFQARTNYENAEANSLKATESIPSQSPFSTANMFKN